MISLLQQDVSDDSYEIVVVDNKPAGEVRQIIQDIRKDYRISVCYVEESKVGLHNARHAGTRAARGEILVFVDDDVIVHPGWLKTILEPFEDPSVAIVGGKALPKWESDVPGWVAQFPTGYLSLLDLGDEKQELKWPKEVYGCNMAVRRSALLEVGGFNPDAMGDRRLLWFRGDGETGLLKKVYAAGHKVIYAPQAWLYHRVPESRMKVEYFYWRAFIHGISNSFSYIRQHSTYGRMFIHMGYCFLQACRYYLNAFCRNNKYETMGKAYYWYGRGRHQFHVLLNRKLLEHVLRDTYF